MFKVSRSGIFIVNFEHISPLVLVFLLLTLSREMPVEKGLTMTESHQMQRSLLLTHFKSYAS